MADEDSAFDGLTEDDLMDDAEVDTMVREAIGTAIGDNQFLHQKIDGWSNNVVEGCLQRLAALNKPIHYIVTCNLTQKAGAGLHASSCARWNDKTDGKLTVPTTDNDEPEMAICATTRAPATHSPACRQDHDRMGHPHGDARHRNDAAIP